MKIFYAVQATGNGHIARAKEIIPYLSKMGTVDTMLSGSNASLEPGFKVKYRSNGISLFYKTCGGLNYFNMVSKNKLFKAYSDAKKLQLDQYDLIINDFDFVTALASRLKCIKSVQFGHQASFKSKNVPRPSQKSFVGEMVLQNYAVADAYLGLHFDRYDSFIYPPIIKASILEADPKDQGHITVYLPSYERHCLEPIFKSMPNIQFHWFLKEVNEPFSNSNIQYFPIGNESFSKSMINAHGVITGGGFETPAEVLYLGKKLMSIPIRDHYEQKCNAEALKRLGVYVLDDIQTSKWKDQINDWLKRPPLMYHQKAANMQEVLDEVVKVGCR